MLLTNYIITEPLGKGHVLIVNCLSGAVDFLEKDIYEKLQSSKFQDIPLRYLRILKDRGYIFENHREEIFFLEQLKKKYYIRQEERIVDLVVSPTFECNLSCPYCFQKSIKKSQYITDIDSLIIAITKISKKTPGEKAIQLFGGEPLLPKNKNLIERLLAYSEKKNLPVAITSNGTTIEHYSKMIDKYSDVIKVAQITLDGPPRIHNRRRVAVNRKPTFDLIKEGAKFLLSKGIAVQARVNIDKTNIDSLPELAGILEKEKFFLNKNFKCTLAPVEDHCSENNTKNLLTESELIKKLDLLNKKNPIINYFSFERIPKIVKHLHNILNNEYSSPRFSYCASNRNGYYVFAPDGLIYACSEAAGHKELAIGKFVPVFEMYKDKMALWNKRSILDLDKCRNCEIAPLCGGGCSFAAYGANKDIRKPYCHQAKQVIMQYIKDKKDSLFEQAKKQIA